MNKSLQQILILIYAFGIVAIKLQTLAQNSMILEFKQRKNVKNHSNRTSHFSKVSYT